MQFKSQKGKIKKVVSDNRKRNKPNNLQTFVCVVSKASKDCFLRRSDGVDRLRTTGLLS